jgi:hypothetical protein
LAHHPQHPFVVDVRASLLERNGDSSVTVSRRLQRDLLHFIADFHLHGRGLPRPPQSIKTGPIQARHLAKGAHGFAFRRGLLDFFKQASAPLTTTGE